MNSAYKKILISFGLISIYLLSGTHLETDDERWTRLASCSTPDEKAGRCVQLFSCPSLMHLFTNPPEQRVPYVKKFECDKQDGIVGVCCPKRYNYNNSARSTSRPLSDKTFCGLQHTDDYFSSLRNDETKLDEFPWVAAVMFSYLNKNDVREEVIYCHGALINPRYVLTSAHCAAITNALSGYWVRLGDYHSRNKTDCTDVSYATDCNEAEDFGIEESFEHPFYNKYDRLYAKINNIGLIRLNKSVEYTDYIRPICLPEEGTVFPRRENVVYSTGWANTKLISVNTIIKRKSSIVVVDDAECIKFLGPFGSSNSQIGSYPVSHDVTKYFTCGIKKQVIRGIVDGEPVMFSQKSQWYLTGISSWNYEVLLNNTTWYTKVVGYLDWIRTSIESLDLKYSKNKSG